LTIFPGEETREASEKRASFHTFREQAKEEHPWKTPSKQIITTANKKKTRKHEQNKNKSDRIEKSQK